MALRPEPLTANDLLALAVQSFDDLLPDGWETSVAAPGDDPYTDRRVKPDALLEVVAPDGSVAAFAVATRMAPAGRDVAPLLTTLVRWSGQHGAVPLIAARYLSPTVRELLDAEACSFIDATGNISVSSPAPALALSRVGENRDPWRRPHVRDTLRGEPAARVARALCDITPPISTASLIATAGASAGAGYRVLDLLFAEGLATKGERGWIAEADWQRLLRRWGTDWAAAEERFTLGFATDDSLDTLLKRLAKEPANTYVLGGEHAAARLTGRKPETIFLHCDDAAALARRLGARSAERKEAAMMLIHARGTDAAAARSVVEGKLRFAAPSQAYADLMLANSDADRLLKAMRRDEHAWRAAG